MKLYIYRGLDGERVPKDATHVIVDNSVTVIKRKAFRGCRNIVSVIMDDSVKRIEEYAFYNCFALLYIQLSKILEYIGQYAFHGCRSLEALFLPSTVKSIGQCAFESCRSMRLLILPNDIDLSKVGKWIITNTAVYQIAEASGVEYVHENNFPITSDESSRRVNEWLFHHMDGVMDDAPFHRLCYNSSIKTKHINDYLAENGTDAAFTIDPYHAMTPLHMLSMNLHATADTIAALLDVNMEAAFCLDNQGKMSMDYARDYNVDGLVGIVNGLCNHRHAAD